MCDAGEVLGACALSFAKPYMDTRRKFMAKWVAEWGMYAIPKILCIKGKKCHDVIHEKWRMMQHDSLQEVQGLENFHYGLKEQVEGQSRISPLSHPVTHCSALVRTMGSSGCLR